MKDIQKVAPATMKVIENTPNASKLLNSLRHSQYSNLSAIEDLVDNSIDAKASQIWIEINGDKNIDNIVISDDGIGLEENVLMEAIKLGSNTEKNPNSDLGRYGMGLITASISLCKKLDVFTKSKSQNEILAATQDLDEVEKNNSFTAQIGKLDEVRSKIFEKHIMDLEKQNPLPGDNNIQINTFNHGTQIKLSKIDRADYNKDALIKKLVPKLSQTFRTFIDASLGIYVNGIKLESIDPIKDHMGQLLIKENIYFEGEVVKVLVYELNNYGSVLNKEKGLNIKNQGFYIMRNGREIAAGQKLGMFTQHGDFNTFRGEIHFPATLDTELKTGFQKSSISLSQSLQDKIFKIVDPQLKGIRQRAKTKQASKREKLELSELEKYITKNKHLLDIPKGAVKSENGNIQKDSAKKNNALNKKKIIGQPDLNKKVIKKSGKDLAKLNVDLASTISLGSRGPLFQPEIEGEKVTINWNEDHPFYNLVILETSENPDIQWPIIFLIYSMASAEIKSASDSDSEIIVENIRYAVGQNLALLMRD